jgi:hypothetical protein
MTILMCAALPATTTQPHAAHPVAGHQPVGDSSLPAGLTDADAERIAAAVAAALTEASRHVYALVWAQWERWCDARGTLALPADPLALCAYLTERAEAGKARRHPQHDLCRGPSRPSA